MSDKDQSQERRAHERIEVEQEVQYREIKFPVVEVTTGVSAIEDISGGGLQFQSAKPFEIGTALQLELRLPGWEAWLDSSVQFAALRGQPLTAVGEVVRCGPAEGGGHAVGVKFTNIYPQHREALFNYLSTHEPLREKIEGLKKKTTGEA